MPAVSALLRKTRNTFGNIERVIAEQPRFKVIFVLTFATLLEVGLCLLFLDGFRFLYRFEGIGHAVVRHLFSLLFMGMGFMLIASSIVTSYATIFRSEEIEFLMVKPFTISEIVIYKFLGSTTLSSWAYFFIVMPFTIAYAWHEKVFISFPLITLLFSIPFLILCSAMGTIVALALVRWGPSGKARRACIIALGLGFIALMFYLAGTVNATSPHAFQLTISTLIPGMRMADNPLFPSWWLSQGIMSLVHGDPGRGLMLFACLVSTALILTVFVESLGRHTFYDAWQRVSGSRNETRRNPVLLSRLNRALRFLSFDIRALAMKDIRTFLRDPMQWSQALIFFGLLALYFSNLRTLNYHVLPGNWRNTIAFLNVFSVSAVVCSLGTRFIYPQLSLEGQGFWIIGLSPTTMLRVLATKFFLSLAAMLTISTCLMMLSSTMLKADMHARIVSIGLAAAISTANCALSTGLGAVFLDLRQRNPSAIVSGFGGTLNLALCLLFMFMAIIPFGIVFHLNTMMRISPQQYRIGLAICAAWLLMITSIATAIPLWLGCKSLQNRDF